MFTHVSLSGQEYVVTSHLHFSNGGYEKCTYDIYLGKQKVAECELTSQVPFVVARFEASS